VTKALGIQTNFTSGELTPRLYAHVDLDKYKNALKTAENVTILPHGPATRRNGSKFIKETKDSTKVSRLIRFQFDEDNVYILEFGHNYIRFFANGANVESGGSPYEVVTTYTQDEVFDITYEQFGRVIFLYHGSHAPATLTYTSAASWTLATIAFYPPATDEDGYKPAATLTPAATSGTGINFTASAASFLDTDVGRQLINLGGVGRAVITAFTSTTVVVCTIIENFPSTSAIASQSWKVDLSPITTVTPSGSKVGALITLTAANPTWQSASAIGHYVLINNGVCKILSLTSNLVANAEVQKSLSALTATTAWSLEEEAWSSTRGYPRAVSICQGRLFSGGTTTQPLAIWGSETGLFTSQGIGSEDSAALQFEVSLPSASKISWMAALRNSLVVGTPNGGVTIGAGTDTVLTPSFIPQQVRGIMGSNIQQPVSLNDEIIYIQKAARKVNSLSYNFDIDNYVSSDLLFFAEHLSEGGIKEIAYTADPDSLIYAVLDTGEMLVCTYVKEQKVLAWTKYTTDGDYESVQTISTADRDEVWVIVKRTINGSTKRYIERFDSGTGEDNTDGFSDSYLVYSSPKSISSITKANPGVVTANSHGFSNGDHVKIIGGDMTEVIGKTYVVANKAANTFELTNTSGANINTTSFTTYVSGGVVHKLVSTVTGLSHLEGEVVQVKADGGVHDDCTVSAGAITLNTPSYELVVGLEYSASIETLPMEISFGSGSQQGQQIRRVRPIVRVYKSANPTLNGEYLPARAPTDKMDSALGLFTGDLFYGNLTWDQGFSSNLTIESSSPFPFTILGIFGSIEGGLK
jgi:hypothetical protein